MPKFKVGDEVVIINDDDYGITIIGSVGIVIDSEKGGEVQVEFKTIGKHKRKATEVDIYYIAARDLDFNVPQPTLTPQERVIKKIREMEERRKKPPELNITQQSMQAEW